jgi:hypothetical protein
VPDNSGALVTFGARGLYSDRNGLVHRVELMVARDLLDEVPGPVILKHDEVPDQV